MKLLSTTQASTVAGGNVVITTAMATVSSIFVASGSIAAGFGGTGLLVAALPIGIFAGCVANSNARSHGGNLGAGAIVGAYVSSASSLLNNVMGWSKTSTSITPSNPNSHRCMNEDCSI